MRSSLAVLLALLSIVVSAAPALAQGETCVDICGPSACVKPWAIPDRWDDVTAIAGYTGERIAGHRTPAWRGNGRWDQEAFVDVSNNGLYDIGESYTDGNSNGLHDDEAYHPFFTGYIARPVAGNFLSPNGDLGLELILHFASTSSPPTAGAYIAFALPPLDQGTPDSGGAAYRDNIRTCNPAQVGPSDRLQPITGGFVGPTNQGMRELIALDPDAYWDTSTQSVQNSAFPVSPRIVIVPVFDPRVPVTGGGAEIRVTKLVAFFMEQMTGAAEVRGKFLQAPAPEPAGQACGSGTGGGFLVHCQVPALRTTWGEVKASYR